MNRWMVKLTRLDNQQMVMGEVEAPADSDIVGAFVAFALGEQRALGRWKQARWRWTLEGVFGVATLPNGLRVDCAVDVSAVERE